MTPSSVVRVLLKFWLNLLSLSSEYKLKIEAADFLKNVAALYKPTCFSILEGRNFKKLVMFSKDSKGNRPQYLELKKVRGSWRKLRNFQLHNLYSLPFITRVRREMVGTCSLNGVKISNVYKIVVIKN
jgi:hypothetical protein